MIKNHNSYQKKINWTVANIEIRFKALFFCFFLCVPSVALSNPTAKEIQDWITYTYKVFETHQDKLFLKKGRDDCTIELVRAIHDTYDEKTEIDFSRNITIEAYGVISIKDPAEQLPMKKYNFNSKYSADAVEIYGKPSSTGLVLIHFKHADKGLIDRFMKAFNSYQRECRKIDKNLF